MGYRQFVQIEAMIEGVPMWRAHWNVASCYVIGWLLQLRCRFSGHDLEDNGYAGPDSGAIHMDCKRCGMSWHTQLY